MRDEIVEEVRRVRHEHAAKFDNDLAAIFADLQERTRKSGRKVVSLPPRPASPRRAKGA
ncbi:MAG: hypothetical protein ACYTKD_25625 [Planctomycetota bacterium]|jgi:hypothetical protein